jgi:hypothetical protein
MRGLKASSLIERKKIEKFFSALDNLYTSVSMMPAPRFGLHALSLYALAREVLCEAVPRVHSSSTNESSDTRFSKVANRGEASAKRIRCAADRERH